MVNNDQPAKGNYFIILFHFTAIPTRPTVSVGINIFYTLQLYIYIYYNTYTYLYNMPYYRTRVSKNPHAQVYITKYLILFCLVRAESSATVCRVYVLICYYDHGCSRYIIIITMIRDGKY